MFCYCCGRLFISLVFFISVWSSSCQSNLVFNSLLLSSSPASSRCSAPPVVTREILRYACCIKVSSVLYQHINSNMTFLSKISTVRFFFRPAWIAAVVPALLLPSASTPIANIHAVLMTQSLVLTLCHSPYQTLLVSTLYAKCCIAPIIPDVIGAHQGTQQTMAVEATCTKHQLFTRHSTTE